MARIRLLRREIELGVYNELPSNIRAGYMYGMKVWTGVDDVRPFRVPTHRRGSSTEREAVRMTASGKRISLHRWENPKHRARTG